MSKEQRHHHFVIYSLLIVICCLLFGCNDFNPQDALPGYGKVAVTIMGAPARTVFPMNAFAKYKYIFTNMTGETEAQDPVDGYFTLKFGDWQVTVNAYVTEEDTVPAAHGTSGTFNVGDEAIAHIVVKLGTDAPGYGRFSYSIAYPEKSEISTFTLENLFTNGRIDISGSGQAGEGSVLLFTGIKEDVPAGYYYLTIELKEDSEESRTAGANEVVYIYDKLDSEYSVSFSSKDFSHIHKWNEWEETKAPTVTDDGSETRKCESDWKGKHPETRTLYATGTDGLKFEIIDYRTAAYRVRNDTADGNVYIPAMYRSGPEYPYLPVTEIGYFQGSSDITGINIPASVTTINGNVFQGCSSLTSITVDVNNQHYASEGGILYNKEKTKLIAVPIAKSGTVTIPAGVKEIGDYAFLNCTALTDISLPSTITSIGSQAFSGCTGIGINGITLPAGLISIGDSAFYNCTGLKNITIPASVTSIGDSVFRYCNSLTGITVDGSNQYYASENGILYNKAKTRLIIAPGAISGNISLPASVSSIDNSAFSGCRNLTGITILAGITSIGEYTFSGCENLTTVSLPAGLISIGNNAFSYCAGLTGITIPAGVTSIGSYAFSNCTGLTGSISIPASVTSIGSYAFSNCTGLTGSISIPASVTSIGSYAFYNCTSLTRITIPASVTSIGEGVLDDCLNLSDITVSGDNPSYTGESGILYNKGKTQVIAVAPKGITGDIDIPSSITSIGSRAFLNCTGLKSIKIPASVTSIGSQAFSGCTGLTSITLQTGLTSIGDSAFYNCASLTNITIPASVISIGSYAFSNCAGLTGISIPAGVTSIGSYAFYNCASLTGILIPTSVTSIDDGTFSNCTALTGITIPANVTSIGSYAFSDCTGLTSITLSANLNLTEIGSYAFSGCTNLTSITLPESLRSIGSYAFNNCTRIASISIPTGVTSIGSYAFFGWGSLQAINVQGYSNQDAADAAWGSGWRDDCNATINYYY